MKQNKGVRVNTGALSSMCSISDTIMLWPHEVIFAIQAATKAQSEGTLCECSRDRAIAQMTTEVFYLWLGRAEESEPRSFVLQC